ncbi:hypothetical protein YQE_13026, partial [Dendroctonus ponderosae]
MHLYQHNDRKKPMIRHLAPTYPRHKMSSTSSVNIVSPAENIVKAGPGLFRFKRGVGATH